jgi:hypothetical protein
MANVFTSTGTEWVGQLVLDAYVQALSPLSAFTMNASNETFYRGDSVRVLVNATASAPLTYTTTYTIQDIGSTGVDVALDRTKYVSWQVLDSEWRDSALMSMENFLRSKGNALANYVLADVLSIASGSTNFSEETSVSASSGFNATSVTNVSLACDNLNMPQFGRSLVLTPSQHTYLRQDTALQAAYAFGSPDIIRKGDVPSIDTFGHVYKTPVVPAGTLGYACVPDAIVFASRVAQPQEGHAYNEVRTLTDEETGLSITMLAWHDPLVGARRNVFVANYGFAIGNNKGLVKLVAI